MCTSASLKIKPVIFSPGRCQSHRLQPRPRWPGTWAALHSRAACVVWPTVRWWVPAEAGRGQGESHLYAGPSRDGERGEEVKEKWKRGESSQDSERGSVNDRALFNHALFFCVCYFYLLFPYGNITFDSYNYFIIITSNYIITFLVTLHSLSPSSLQNETIVGTKC